MKAKRLLSIAIALMGVSCLHGCSQTPPTLAGGKPVDYWFEALKNPDPKLRKQAAFKLGNVGPSDKRVFPALAEALKDPDARVRCEAVLALMKFGNQAKEARAALDDLKNKDRDAQVRQYAAKALEVLKKGD